MSVAEFMINFLYDKGVRHVFTVSGGGSIFLCDALAKSQAEGRMKYIACHHEQAAGYAAEAYARLRGLAVCLVTSGPGGTNAVSACASAWLDSVPVIFISGQAFLKQTITGHPGLRQMGVQEINIVDIVRPITKGAMMLNSIADIWYLRTACDLAITPRSGPVWLDVPGCIQNAPI